uniref:Apolipoprotein M n=1 Tax=Cyprinodon variegatus TaxID=28743 RepID=A0A3Q2EH79_CYPVA
MFAAFAVVILSLFSLSHSTPLVCEKLLHPLESPSPRHVEGRWALIANSDSYGVTRNFIERRDSTTLYFSNSSDPYMISFTQVNRIGNVCQHEHLNISVDGNVFVLRDANKNSATGSLLYTSCPDCLVVKVVLEIQGNQIVQLSLLSRRGTVEPKEMEEFRAQLKCSSFPLPFVTDPTKELCSEHPQS